MYSMFDPGSRVPQQLCNHLKFYHRLFISQHSSGNDKEKQIAGKGKNLYDMVLKKPSQQNISRNVKDSISELLKIK